MLTKNMIPFAFLGAALLAGCAADVKDPVKKLPDETTPFDAQALDDSDFYAAGVRYHQHRERCAADDASADAGYVPAQYALGKLFLDGKGVQPNRGLAHAWFNIAAGDTWGFREANWAREMVNELEGKLTPEETAFAQDWAGKWEPESEWYLADLK